MTDAELVTIEPAAIDSNFTALASFGILDVLTKLYESSQPTGEEEGEAPVGIDINMKDDRGCSALVWAARNGHLPVCSYLLEKGADVNSVSYGGLTPLHHACMASFESVVGKLIESGADANMKDESGNSPLNWATSRGVLNIVMRLVDAGGDVNASNKVSNFFNMVSRISLCTTRS